MSTAKGTSAGADFRPDINALRAFAVLAVVAYHYGLPGAGGGFAGVDVFFVISGYLIGAHILTALDAGRFSFSRFFQSRFRRIFPALAVLGIACLAWGWWFVLPYDYLKSTRHVMAAEFFLSNLAFMGEQGYFDLAAHAKPLLHTWSLSVEGQFYLFLPLVMAVVWRWLRQHMVLVLVGLWLASAAWGYHTGQTHPSDAFYALLARAWEFLTGCLLSQWRVKWPHIAVRNAVSVVAVLMLLAGFAGLNANMTWPGLWTLWPVAAASAVMLAGDAPLTARLWRSWPLQRLGDVSYSFYLWHWPVLVFAKQYLQPDDGLSAWVLWALAALSLVLATISWRWVEQPTRAQPGWWSAKRLWLGVGCVWLATLGFGVYVVKTRGAPERLPSYVQRASSVVFLNTPRDECFRRGDGTKDATETFCHFGAGQADTASALLWGDSHANQYLSALTDAADALHMGGWIATQSGCRATLAGQPTGLPESIAAGCAKFNDQVNAFIAQTPAIRTVVIGRLWSQDDSFDRTLALVEQLVLQGKQVLLIGPLPEPGIDVPQVWAVQQLKARQAIDDFTVPLAGQTNAVAMRDAVLARLKTPLCQGQVVLVDPMARLCNGQSCWLAQAGQANFRDTSHLSHTTSLKFTEDLRSGLQVLSKAAAQTPQAKCVGS